MKRRLERKQLREQVNFTHADTDADAGHVVDITVEGIMIESAQPFDADYLYRLKLQLPTPMDGTSALDLGVDCLWSRPADTFRGHWAGFQIIDASDQTLDTLQALIDEYAV